MKSQDIIAVVLRRYPHAQAIYGFGSWGTGRQRAESDIDLGVLLPPDTPTADLLSLGVLLTELASLADVAHADVVHLRSASTAVQEEILRTGKLIYCSDADARAAFESLVLAQYHDMEFWRRPIRQAVLNEVHSPTP